MTNKKMSAVVCDTYQNRNFLKIAIDRVSACSQVDEIIVLSYQDMPGCRLIKIDPITSVEKYNKLILLEIIDHIKNDHALIFQWDGFPLNENLWTNNFFNYDFIGAPNYSEIYKTPFFNGGFSLRSRKLMCEVRSLIRLYSNLTRYPEDALICHLLREKLESKGLIFPGIEFAGNFSYELGVMPHSFFGFHGAFNFPFFFKEADLVNLSDELMERLNQPNIILHLLNNAYQMNYLDFIQVCLNNIESWPSLKLVVEYLSKNPSESEVGKLVEKFFKTS